MSYIWIRTVLPFLPYIVLQGSPLLDAYQNIDIFCIGDVNI